MADNSEYSKLEKIRKSITVPAQLEQMAEECCELAQVLLKKARKIRNENFTPKDFDEINKDLLEEFSDVILCSKVINLNASDTIMKEKLDRWIFRNN